MSKHGNDMSDNENRRGKVNSGGMEVVLCMQYCVWCDRGHGGTSEMR